MTKYQEFQSSKVKKIFSVLSVVIFGALGFIATVAATDPTIKPFIYFFTILSIIIALLWVFDSYIGFKTLDRIVKGAKQIGVINIRPDRLHGGNFIDNELQNASKIRIFAVSGNNVLESYGTELRYALHTNSANIRIIFSTHDDYLDEYLSVIDKEEKKILM